MFRFSEKSHMFKPHRSTIVLILVMIFAFSVLIIVSKFAYTSSPAEETFGIDNWIFLHIFEILGFLALVLSIIHSLRVYGRDYTLIFFPSCFLYGLILELPFDSYNQNAWLKVGPYGSMLSVVAGWCVICYILLSISRRMSCNLSVIDRGILCGLLSVSIDIPLDPIAYAYGLWVLGWYVFWFSRNNIFWCSCYKFHELVLHNICICCVSGISKKIGFQPKNGVFGLSTCNSFACNDRFSTGLYDSTSALDNGVI